MLALVSVLALLMLPFPLCADDDSPCLGGDMIDSMVDAVFGEEDDGDD